MKSWSTWLKYALVVVGLIVLIALLMDFNQRLEDLNRINAQLATVGAEGTTVMQTQVALITQVAYAGSNRAVEQWAYVDGRWVREGENLIELLPAGNSTQVPTPLPVSQTPELQNWQVWWELFFGG